MDLLNKLGDNGVVGAVLAVSIFANGYLLRLLLESYEKRLVDIKENKETILKLLESIKQTADTTLTGLQSVITNNK